MRAPASGSQGRELVASAHAAAASKAKKKQAFQRFRLACVGAFNAFYEFISGRRLLPACPPHNARLPIVQGSANAACGCSRSARTGSTRNGRSRKRTPVAGSRPDKPSGCPERCFDRASTNDSRLTQPPPRKNSNLAGARSVSQLARGTPLVKSSAGRTGISTVGGNRGAARVELDEAG